MHTLFPEWTDKEKLDKEQEVIGFYLSSHPLDMYQQQLKWLSVSTFSQPTYVAAKSKHHPRSIGSRVDS